MAYMLGITAELYPTSMTRLSNGVQPASSRNMPFGVRLFTKFEYKPLRSFTADDIKLLRLDYASQDDPQLLMEEYLPIKNFELLYGWWKQHYKATLKDCDNPQAIILHLASTD